MDEALRNHLESELNLAILRVSSVSGGDINDAWNIQLDSGGVLFVKTNRADSFPKMFKLEANGLETLGEYIRTPEVIQYGEFDLTSYLVLEWLEESREHSNWKCFGNALAQLHSNSQTRFGWKEDNYIGSLVQKNKAEESASEFYVKSRLLPQIEMADKQGLINKLELTRFEKLFDKMSTLIPNEKPGLTHGDLWSGNWMFVQNGEPALIDPAVSFAPREMDLAMMTLFGNPPKLFFESYQEAFPLISGWKDRLALFQLYYLLVHLNLFGKSYKKSVMTITNKYVA